MTATSVSASAIRASYLPDDAKAALLGYGGPSFGLPYSTITTFKLSALTAGPVVLVDARGGDQTILPISAIAVSNTRLEADVSANIGWLAPPDVVDEHNEPWLSTTPVLWYGGEDKGSIVTLPHTTAEASSRFWPECLHGRSLVLALPAPPVSRSSKKDEKDEKPVAKATAEAPLDPEVSLIVFYAVL